MSAFLIKRGKRARIGVARAHLAKYDSHGNIIGSWCGAKTDLSSNVPWGLRQCRHCLRMGGWTS